MTLTNDDWRIVLDGDTAPIEPSAPPLTDLTGSERIPIVVAMPIPLPNAPHHEAWMTTADADAHAAPVPPNFASHLTGVATTTTADNSVGRRVERTNEPDGSLSIEATITTSRPDGHHMVRIENFRIPAGDVVGQAAAHASLDDGRSPGDAYLNRVEVRTYPPGSRIRTDDGDARSQAERDARAQRLDKMHPEHPDYGRPRREKLCVCCWWCWGTICSVFVVLIIIVMVSPDSSSGNEASPTPTVPPNLYDLPTPAPTPSMVFSEKSYSPAP